MSCLRKFTKKRDRRKQPSALTAHTATWWMGEVGGAGGVHGPRTTEQPLKLAWVQPAVAVLVGILKLADEPLVFLITAVSTEVYPSIVPRQDEPADQKKYAHHVEHYNQTARRPRLALMSSKCTSLFWSSITA